MKVRITTPRVSPRAEVGAHVALLIDGKGVNFGRVKEVRYFEGGVEFDVEEPPEQQTSGVDWSKR